MLSRTLTFVTGNQNKLKEVKEICGSNFPLSIVNLKLDLDEYQGEAEFISKKKSLAACEKVGGAVLVEDTCLCFNALNGLPGPYIKWFLDSLGPIGLFKMLHGFEDKSAYAQCTFAYCAPGEEPQLFIGKVHGQIVGPRGQTTFGWDPIFQPNGFDKTFAELQPQEKNEISHRARALVKLKTFFMEDCLLQTDHNNQQGSD